MTEEQRPRFHHEEVGSVRWHLEGRSRADRDLPTVLEIECTFDHRDEVNDPIPHREVEAFDHLVEVVAESQLRVHGVALHTEAVGVHLLDGSAKRVCVDRSPLVGELLKVVGIVDFVACVGHGLSFRAGDLRTGLH